MSPVMGGNGFPSGTFFLAGIFDIVLNYPDNFVNFFARQHTITLSNSVGFLSIILQAILRDNVLLTDHNIGHLLSAIIF